tara:strand:- start:897 stop:1202 length:306 start_codon:yes stop_codon:yes gene_type:complete
MANGTLGQSALAANTDTTVYTPSSVATVNVSLVNKGTNTAAIRLAVAASGTPSTAEYLEYDTILGVGDVLERTGVVITASKNVVARSNVANVAVNIYGYEA